MNKQKPEAFLHADVHGGWDIVSYQELQSAPELPFGWHASQSHPQVLSSHSPNGAEGACILVAEQFVDFVTPLTSPCPGALFTATSHLPDHPPVLTVSVSAQPPRRPEIERPLNILFYRHQRWVIGEDFNALFSSADTNRKILNKWNWLLSPIYEKRHGVNTLRVVHHDQISFTRYRNVLLQCDPCIDYLFASKSLITTPQMSMADADILHHDTSSDHHPITFTLQLLFMPAQSPPPFHALPQAHLE